MNYPRLVCYDCAIKAKDYKVPAHNISTYNEENCDICKEFKLVTNPRNFGFPDFTDHPKILI